MHSRAYESNVLCKMGGLVMGHLLEPRSEARSKIMGEASRMEDKDVSG